MKAVLINAYGANDVVQLGDIEVPHFLENEVLVKIETAGVNPIDWKIRGGAGQRLGLSLPIALGGEIAGTIESVGKEVNQFKKGDVIYGMVKTGAFAEYVAAKASDIVPKPTNIDLTQAAAIPLCGLTAWQAVFDLGNLVEGQRILITGASGAVGSLAVQFAKSVGAYVIGTASGRNEQFVRSLGADDFINYENKAFEKEVTDVDLVCDTVGGDTFEKSYYTLKTGGTLITTVAFPDDKVSSKFGVTAKRVFCKPDQNQLTQMSQLVEAGKLKARVSKVFPLGEVKDALALSESGKANGKIVLKVAQ